MRVGEARLSDTAASLKSVYLGADLRALRKSRGLTLQDVADRLGKSVVWLSQVERDISRPEDADMQHLADLLDVPVGLLTPVSEEGVIVRKDGRRAIGERIAGLTEELVSPDLTDAFEVVHSTFAPGVSRSDEVLRPTQEIAYLVSGRLDIWINGTRHILTPGDSARIRAQSFRWANPYDEPAIAMWVIAPPVY